MDQKDVYGLGNGGPSRRFFRPDPNANDDEEEARLDLGPPPPPHNNSEEEEEEREGGEEDSKRTKRQSPILPQQPHLAPYHDHPQQPQQQVISNEEMITTWPNYLIPTTPTTTQAREPSRCLPWPRDEIQASIQEAKQKVGAWQQLYSQRRFHGLCWPGTVYPTIRNCQQRFLCLLRTAPDQQQLLQQDGIVTLNVDRADLIAKLSTSGAVGRILLVGVELEYVHFKGSMGTASFVGVEMLAARLRGRSTPKASLSPWISLSSWSNSFPVGKKSETPIYVQWSSSNKDDDGKKSSELFQAPVRLKHLPSPPPPTSKMSTVAFHSLLSAKTQSAEQFRQTQIDFVTILEANVTNWTMITNQCATYTAPESVWKRCGDDRFWATLGEDLFTEAGLAQYTTLSSDGKHYEFVFHETVPGTIDNPFVVWLLNQVTLLRIGKPDVDIFASKTNSTAVGKWTLRIDANLFKQWIDRVREESSKTIYLDLTDVAHTPSPICIRFHPLHSSGTPEGTKAAPGNSPISCAVLLKLAMFY